MFSLYTIWGLDENSHSFTYQVIFKHLSTRAYVKNWRFIVIERDMVSVPEKPIV